MLELFLRLLLTFHFLKNLLAWGYLSSLLAGLRAARVSHTGIRKGGFYEKLL